MESEKKDILAYYYGKMAIEIGADEALDLSLRLSAVGFRKGDGYAMNYSGGDISIRSGGKTVFSHTVYATAYANPDLAYVADLYPWMAREYTYCFIQSAGGIASLG